MLSLRLALRSLRRNFKYTIGLIPVYFFTSVLCVSFFLFNNTADGVYRKILDRQASTFYVSLAFGDSESGLYDLTKEELSAIENIENIAEIEKFAYNFGAACFSLNGRKRIREEVSIIATERGTMPQAYKTEFSTLYGKASLICGREPQEDYECLVSEKFVSLAGEESAVDLLGQVLSLTDLSGNPVASLTIVGVIDDGFGSVAAMDESSECFLFTDINSIEKSAIGMYYYLLFADYSSLPDIMQSVEGLSLKNVTVSMGNDSYAMKKLAQISEFISAILILIAVLCIVACIAFITGTAMLKFTRNRSFYYAAFSVGLSKGKLVLSFLFEFIIVAVIAFMVSVPTGIVAVNGLFRLISVFVGLTITAELNISVILLSLIPLVLSAVISVLFVRKKIVYGG